MVGELLELAEKLDDSCLEILVRLAEKLATKKNLEEDLTRTPPAKYSLAGENNQ